MAGKTIALTVLSVLSFAGSVAAAEVQRFRLSQARVELPSLKAYLDVLDSTGKPVAGTPSPKISGTLGGRSLRLDSFTPFDKSGEGVAYVFVVDTSESISARRFDSVRGAIETWIKGAGAKDRIAVLEFAEKVRVVADFSDSKDKAIAAIKKLERVGETSLIHQAMIQAIELSSRRDAGLPARRVITVISDGKDEGSGLRADDVLERARVASVPVYALGYSNLPPAERRQYLDELHRIAAKSGGEYAEVSDGGLTNAFDAMRKTIRGVFVAKLTCSGCPVDSKNARLELHLDAGTRAFSDALDVLVSTPPPPGPSTNTPSTPWWKQQWWKQPWWVYVAAGGVLTALLLVLTVWRRRKRRKANEAPGAPDKASIGLGVQSYPQDVPLQPAGSTSPIGSPVNLAPPSAIAAPVRVQFTVVRGPRKGVMSELHLSPSTSPSSLSGRVLIGRKTGCDLALADDETVSGEHCELLWITNKLVIRDLQSSNGTLVNGVPIAGDQPLESGDRIAIGRTEYRLGVIKD